MYGPIRSTYIEFAIFQANKIHGAGRLSENSNLIGYLSSFVSDRSRSGLPSNLFNIKCLIRGSDIRLHPVDWLDAGMSLDYLGNQAIPLVQSHRRLRSAGTYRQAHHQSRYTSLRYLLRQRLCVDTLFGYTRGGYSMQCNTVRMAERYPGIKTLAWISNWRYNSDLRSLILRLLQSSQIE